ncbi:hypothetical protein YW7DRAFT_04673 [Streptomyces sp. AmelKG-E11A]|nr:hypothetical protein YW7DRAFT_04673 [Streptomyces sp. AmelKG-E11A]
MRGRPYRREGPSAPYRDEIHADLTHPDLTHADLTHEGHVHRPWTHYGRGLWALVASGSKAFNFPALTGSYGVIGDPADRTEFLRRTENPATTRCDGSWSSGSGSRCCPAGGTGRPGSSG